MLITVHSIDIYLIRKEDLRDDKINQILDNKKVNNKFYDLGEGIFATLKLPKSKEWRKDKLICHIETDYFGGFGDQSALLIRGTELQDEIIYEGDTRFGHTPDPINNALKLMGVICKPGMDEFDTIGLGRFRTNKDFK